MKELNRYKKGFREGYNNPKQNSNIDLNKVNDSNELAKGIISGVIERRKDIANGINKFIWSDKELNERVV